MEKCNGKSYSLGLYEKSMPNRFGIAQKLKAGKAAGFDFMEISIDESDEKLARLDMSADERKYYVEVMSETGMPIRTMCLSGHRKFSIGSADPAIAARGMDIMCKAIELAFDLGIRIIQLAGYDVYYEKSTPETRARFAENLKKSVEMAAARGVILAFETMETEFMNTVSKAMHFVHAIDSPYLQVYPDLGNITNAAKTYHQSVLEDLKAGTGHIVAMHLKETVPGKFREIPFGTGHVDFKPAVSLVSQMGVHLFVGEFWDAGGDWKATLEQTNSFLREKFQ